MIPHLTALPTPPGNRRPAFTLLEVMVAMAIFAMCCGGIISTLIQSRRMTEADIAEVMGLTAAQSYMEQLKNTAPKDLISDPSFPSGSAALGASFALPTTLTETSLNGNQLMTTPSTGTNAVAIPSLTSLIPGTTPAGVVDNFMDISTNANSTNGDSTQTWAQTWPNANTYVNAPATNPVRNDLHLDVWVWITDESVGNSTLSNTALEQHPIGMTIIYTVQYWDGLGFRYVMGSLRSIRALDAYTFTTNP